MSFSVLFTPEAEAEIGEAFEWYEQRVVGLGSEFLRAVEVAVSSVARAPLQYPVWRRGARRVLLRKFPFAVFYTLRDENIVVFACFHGNRNSKRLLRRLQNAKGSKRKGVRSHIAQSARPAPVRPAGYARR